MSLLLSSHLSLGVDRVGVLLVAFFEPLHSARLWHERDGPAWLLQILTRRPGRAAAVVERVHKRGAGGAGGGGCGGGCCGGGSDGGEKQQEHRGSDHGHDPDTVDRLYLDCPYKARRRMPWSS